MNNKLMHLQNIVRNYGTVALAFSGGVDSTFLLKVARDVMPKDCILAITARSTVYSVAEMESASALAKELDVNHLFLDFDHLSFPPLAQNVSDRCYICKKHLFGKLVAVAHSMGYSTAIDGSNADDVNSHRPGRKASAEIGVKSPLEEALLTKSEIRLLSKQFGLPTFNKPSMPCYLTRFKYNTVITEEMLKQVDTAETELRELGFNILRLRHDGDTARIVTSAEEMSKVLLYRSRIVPILSNCGFLHHTLDLAAYGE